MTQSGILRFAQRGSCTVNRHQQAGVLVLTRCRRAWAMAVGAKVNVSNAEAKTQMALLFQLSVPLGDDSFSSDRWDPSLAFIWAHKGDIAIAGTVKVSKFQSGYQLDNGLKVPFSWGDVHSGFVEWEASLPEDGGTTHWLNGGYQWLPSDRNQLDFNAGLGLNDRAGDYRLGVGFSIRF